MKISARVRANRANARRSTGPKTNAGKSQVAHNALKHGLAIPLSADAEAAPAIERLARALAGAAADPLRLDAARHVAEAQIDLIRIRRARLALLNDQNVRVKKPRVEKFPTRELVLVRRQDKEDSDTHAALAARRPHASCRTQDARRTSLPSGCATRALRPLRTAGSVTAKECGAGFRRFVRLRNDLLRDFV